MNIQLLFTCSHLHLFTFSNADTRDCKSIGEEKGHMKVSTYKRTINALCSS